MKIRFFDKEIGKDAKLSRECVMFLVGKDGGVVEYLEQGYANHYDHLCRDDVGVEIIPDEWDEESTIVMCIAGCGPQNLRGCRCGHCDVFLGWFDEEDEGKGLR